MILGQLKIEKHQTKCRALPGLYKLFHPAAPDGRTWSKMGELENIACMENMEMMKHQTDDFKHFISNSKDYIYDSNHSICQKENIARIANAVQVTI